MVYFLYKKQILSVKTYSDYFKYFFFHNNIFVDKIIKKINVYNKWFNLNLLDYFFFNYNRIVYNKVSNFKNFFFYLIAFFFNYSFFNKLKLRPDRYFNFYKPKKKAHTLIKKNKLKLPLIRSPIFHSTFSSTKAVGLLYKQKTVFWLIKRRLILNLIIWDY